MSRLIDEIKKYQEGFKQKVPKETQEIMLKATKQLEEQSLSKNVLKVGDTFPAFKLMNAVGTDVAINDVLAKNDFVVLNFYRGAWCPYCNLELKALQNILPDLEAKNATIIAISPQSPDSSLTTKEKNELNFEVLSDINNNLAKEVGLVFSLADELKPIYLSFGIDIPKSNAEDSYELPMPATFVLNKQKEIIYAFVDEDYTKRSEPQEILDIITKNA